MTQVHRYELTVPEDVVDENDHVNNVAYVQWMQDAAMAHSDTAGCTRETQAMGATWVARMHHIEYLRPAFAGERVEVSTWVADMKVATSLRKYEFKRLEDDVVLARGETDWVFVDRKRGRPRVIPREFKDLFGLETDLELASE